MNDLQQQRSAEWVDSRGLRLYDGRERSLRFGEESIELMQAAGLTPMDIVRLIRVVYRKPVGDIRKEAGGVGHTLLAFAECHGFQLSDAIDEEQDRIYALPIERFQNRNRMNANDGIGAPPEIR